MARTKTIAFSCAALLLGASVSLIYALPAVAAGLCPACYGMQKLQANLYSDTHNPDIAPTINAARARVTVVWGKTQSDPLILACHTPDCDHRMGGRGALGMSYGTSVIHLSPAGLTESIVAHELAHAELHHRLGPWRWWTSEVPAWLDEGIAVLVSQDARHLNRPTVCEGLTNDNLPQTAKDWRRRARAEHDLLYTQAACAAQDWLAARGGMAALPGMFP